MFLPILLSPTSSLMIARPEKALSKKVQASVSLGTSLKRQRVNLEHRIKKRGLIGGGVQTGSCEPKGARVPAAEGGQGWSLRSP